MKTIITRVEEALRESGHASLAVELRTTLDGMVNNIRELLKLHEKARLTTRQYIATIQRECGHRFKHTKGVEHGIDCRLCGWSIIDREAWRFVQRVLQMGNFAYSSDKGVILSAPLRARLEDLGILRPSISELINKETDDVQQTTLRGDSQSTGQEPAAAGARGPTDTSEQARNGGTG